MLGLWFHRRLDNSPGVLPAHLEPVNFLLAREHRRGPGNHPAPHPRQVPQLLAHTATEHRRQPTYHPALPSRAPRLQGPHRRWGSQDTRLRGAYSC